MERRQKQVGFELSISARDDGTLEAIYILLGDAPVEHTEEVLEDILLVDYSAEGKVVGIEVLAPVSLNDIAKLVEPPNRRKIFRKFLQEQAPQELVFA